MISSGNNLRRCLHTWQGLLCCQTRLLRASIILGFKRFKDGDNTGVMENLLQCLIILKIFLKDFLQFLQVMPIGHCPPIMPNSEEFGCMQVSSEE